MSLWARPWIVFSLLAFSARADAYEIREVQVSHLRGRYDITFDVRLAADPAAVRRLLTDYPRLNRLSSTVVESRVLSRTPERVRIALTLRACILWMCRNISEVEDVRSNADGSIEGKAVPAQSDFHELNERWRILPDGDATRVRYEASMKPKFFVPPLIGPWLMKIKMRDELRASAQRLEALAAHE